MANQNKIKVDWPYSEIGQKWPMANDQLLYFSFQQSPSMASLG